MTKAWSPTTTEAAVSSLNFGLKLNPSLAKNALLRSTSATGMLTNSMRPACAGVVMVSLQSVVDGVRTGRPAQPAKLIATADASVLRCREAPTGSAHQAKGRDRRGPRHQDTPEI